MPDRSHSAGTAPNPAPFPPAAHSRSWAWVWWLVVAGIAAAGWHYWPQISPHLEAYLPKTAAPKTKGAPRPTPVVTAVVQERDMPLYLNGLGTVTALKTVTVRSRVEGELVKVAFVEGQMVHEGELLAEIDPRPFEVQRDQAVAQRNRDEATLRAAEQTLERYTQLRKTNITTQQQVDDQKSLVEQAQAAIKADEAMIANAELQLTYCRITAPISGRIGLRMVDEGNIVQPGDANGLAVITQLQPIALVFTIPQDEVARVQRAMQSQQTLTVDAFDRDFRNRLASGKLLAIDNQVDPTNGTVRLKAEFPNDDGLLFPNQFVNARLLVETRSNAHVIPTAAVQRGPNGPFVYVVQPDETVDGRPIVPGPTEGTDTAVDSGLAAGDIVVTEGIDKLQPKAKVALREKSNDGTRGTAKSERKDERRNEGDKSKSEVGGSGAGEARKSTQTGSHSPRTSAQQLSTPQ